MPLRPRITVTRLAGAGLAILGTLTLAGLLFAWSGVYNVAASRGHWPITEWALTFVMRNSVEKRSLAIATPPLDDPDLMRLGAAHFHGACAHCHGAPGMPIGPVARNMLPAPPDLAAAAREWKPRELFWIVKHGIKYTGMPAWTSQQRDDEVWAVVAFLRELPMLEARSYRELAMGSVQVPQQGGREIATMEATDEAVSACGRCHGADDRKPASRLVPILHGQRAEFLTAALRAYAEGKRESGIMQPVAADLSPEALRRVADYYSGLAPPGHARPEQSDAAAVERGRVLATGGLPDAEIPPCATCHGADALNSYPRLAGQHAPYMRNRLRLWKSGSTAGTAADEIMAAIARRLNDRQIEEVTAYFASEAPAASKAQEP
jgi:cytochrome c553